VRLIKRNFYSLENDREGGSTGNAGPASVRAVGYARTSGPKRFGAPAIIRPNGFWAKSRIWNIRGYSG